MSQDNNRSVIIPAGGVGARMGLPYPKQLLPFGETTVLEASLALFAGERIVVAVPEEWADTFREKIGNRAEVVLGGPSRYRSVRNGVDALGHLDDNHLILVHDAARPFLDRTTLPDAWAKAAAQGALIYAAPATDTIKQVDDQDWIIATHDRRFIMGAQTPQIFRAALLQQAYAAFDAADERMPDGSAPTDEAGLLEAAGIPVAVFRAGHGNRKLTLKEDLGLLHTTESRIGHGYDVHAFDNTRPLYLGGVQIPGGPGLAGHSDADVALHALMDALLGAAGLGDIGQHFPDTDPKLKGIRSTELLRRVHEDLDGRGWRVVNADVTIQAQIPRLAPHIEAMRTTTATVLQIDASRVNFKATTTERLGFVGKKEGIAADAVALLQRST